VTTIDHLTRISATGSSLPEAHERLNQLVPEGMVLVLSYYRNEFGVNTLKENGESDEIAIRKIETKLPRNARIITKRLIQKSTSRTIQVQVSGNLKDALDEAKFMITPPEVVRGGKLMTPASNGVFGIGAKKAVYLVNVGVTAIAEAVFETPVDLIGCVGSEQMKELILSIKDWYKTTASTHPYLFLPDKTCQVCGKSLKANPHKSPQKVMCENCASMHLGTANWETALKHLNLDFGPGLPVDILLMADNIK
jgi:hypothetical protein